MKGFLRSVVVFILVSGVIVALWGAFGGDIPGFFASIWSFVWTCITAVAGVVTQIFGFFGLGS